MPRQTLRFSLRNRLIHEGRLLLVATQFLTRLPIPELRDYHPQWLHQSSRHFPAVGMLIGLLCALVFWLGTLLFSPLVAAVASTAFGIKMTGAFHEDGLADTCDGLGGGLTRERALTIMKDSRLGTFGTLGLVMAVLLKVALLASMPTAQALVALILGHCGSRLLCISLIALLPYGGDIEHAKAKPMAQQLTAAQGIMGALWLALALLLTTMMWPDTVAAIPAWQWSLTLLLAILATDYMRRLLHRRLNGYTGDGLGASQQLAELAIYAGLALQL